MKLKIPERMPRGFIGLLVLCATLQGSPIAAKNACDLAKTISETQGRAGLCVFDASTRSFKGSKQVQAQCLTREVKQGAALGNPTITEFLTDLLASSPPGVADVKSFIDKQGIEESDLGGPLNKTIGARYFIIHDTSTPNCSDKNVGKKACPTLGQFPPNLNDADWVVNQGFLAHPKKYPNRLAHAFTNRVGDSITEVDFEEQITTTKFEKCFDGPQKRKLFIGVENIQPRLGRPNIPEAGKKLNDLVAPAPGFSDKQYDRLALLYIAASSRHGEWLLLAHHAVLDHYFADGHDDPQNFNMEKLSAAVSKALEKMK